MSVISDLMTALLGRARDEQLRTQLRDELQAADAWEWPLLLEFVVANPASDGPRLLAADWLEDEGDSLRAQFIRLQCRSAYLLDMYGAAAASEGEVVTTRAGLQSLLEPLRGWLTAEVFALEEARIALAEDGGVAVCGGGMSLEYSRGFIGQVEMATPRFMELAAELFRAHPITAVRLTDKNPVKAIGGTWWWADSCLDPTTPACLARYVPEALYRFMTGSTRVNGRPRQGVNPADLTFVTPEAAYAALSRACIGYGRAQAAEAA